MYKGARVLAFQRIAILLVLTVFFTCGDDTTGPPSEMGSLRINEFLASNTDGLLDEDGDDSEWIELLNTGSAAVDLSGWHITDDASEPTRWTFPAVTIQPGGYLVVFASDKDRTPVGGELHTNFKLSAAGEYLGLIRPDGSTTEDEFAPSFPPQTNNLTYGHLPGGGLGFLRTPTPNAANSEEALLGLSISPEAGVFTGSLPVTLSAGGGSSVPVHYTTDGSEPTTASPLYTAPLSVTQTSRVRARTFDGGVAGPEVSAFYTEVTDSVAAFQSDLPIVIIHTFGANIPDNDTGVSSAMTIVNTSSGTAQSTDMPNYSGGTTIDARGYTSAEFPKRQFKLELQDVSGSDLDADLLGMGAEEDWVLYAPGRFDRNMIANPLMQRLAGKVGLTELAQTFVEVFLEEGSGGPVGAGDYQGIYILSENVKIDQNRIDLETLGAGDNTEPAVTGGYIVKIDRADSDEYGFKTTTGFPEFVNPNTLVVVRPKLDALTGAQQAWIEGYINDFEAALYGPNSTDPTLGYRPYIDVPSWIDAHILRLLAKDTDFLVFSHFMTKDREGTLRTEPLWDFDRALASDDPWNMEPNEIFHPERADPFGFGWWGALFADPAFLAQYEARWAELRGGVLSEAALFNDIDQLASLITNAYPREDDRWGSLSRYGSRYGDFPGEITALKAWLTTRLALLDTTLNRP
ncbi:MAG: CotH kinase family protein [Longimicrobiales bacterium]